MEQQLIEYMQFINNLDILFFSKYEWLRETIDFIIFFAIFLTGILVFCSLFHAVKEKQFIIEGDRLVNNTEENKEKIRKDFKKYRKYLFICSLLFLSLLKINFYIKDCFQTYIKNEIQQAAEKNNILNNIYYKNAVFLIKIFKEDNYFNSFVIFKKEVVKDDETYNKMIKELNEKYYLSSLSEKELELQKTIKNFMATK